MSETPTARKALAIAGGVIGTAILVWPLAVWAFYDRSLAINAREYDPYIIAEVTVKADKGEDMRQVTGKGFRQVAGFIFGGNVKQSKISMTSPVQTEHEDGKGEKSEKIAMTTPVATEMSAEGYKIAFVMPSKYKSKDDLPKPNNAAVQLREVPSHLLAAISWRGYPNPSDEVIRRKEEELRKVLADAGIEVADGAATRLYQYWPPFAPGLLKEYDVLLPVKRESVPSSFNA